MDNREAEVFGACLSFVAEMGRRYYEYRYKGLVDRTESPIERMLLAEFVAFEVATRPAMAIVSGDDYEWPQPRGAGFREILIQPKIGVYRADFLIIDPCKTGTRFTAVECDGHDYHERTKAQAGRDRSRDRWMAQHDIGVVRFTGSEIWKDPAICVAEAVLIAGKAAKLLGGSLSPAVDWRFNRPRA